MRPTLDDHNAFLAGHDLPGVNFKLNSSVEIVRGPLDGQVGAIISVESLGTDPVYFVELIDGSDALVAQSCLRIA